LAFNLFGTFRASIRYFDAAFADGVTAWNKDLRVFHEIHANETTEIVFERLLGVKWKRLTRALSSFWIIEPILSSFSDALLSLSSI